MLVHFNASALIDSAQDQVYGATVADFDNDGDIDIATIDYIGNDLNWFKNDLIVLSSPDFNLKEISIYPNPVINRLNFKGTLEHNFEVRVYNVLGEQVLVKSLTADKSLDVSYLNSGIYFIKFKDVDAAFKFVKH